MRRVICALSVCLLLASSAFALVIALTPLSELMGHSTFIVTATVDELDAERPSMVLKLDDQLKGKPEFKSMAVLLKGDARAKKGKEVPELLKRLDKKLSVVVFILKDNKSDDYEARVFTNGTWFSLTGTPVEKEVRWSLMHLEPYLRRTFKGTTKEMTDTVKDALAKKKDPPKPDEKEKPGLGPEVEKKKCDQCEEEPQYGVVAPVLIGGPLMLLAMLFPTAFGDWKRWLALLSTAGTNSTLYGLQWWFAESLAGTWWGSSVTLWAAMGVVNVLGVGWAYQRHLSLAQAGKAPGRPGRIETIVLGIISLLAVGGLLALPVLKSAWQVDLPQNDRLLLISAGIAVWVGCAYAIYARIRPPSMVPAVASEVVILTGLCISGLLLSTALQPASARASGGLEGEQKEMSGESWRIAWKFRLPAAGSIMSSPVVDGERVYVAAAHDHSFRPYGVLYCLDRVTGKVVWQFPDDKIKLRMKPVYSSPAIAGGKLFIGEGFHTDTDCKVFCLDATTGKYLWDFATTSHTESTAAIADGKVYIGAGDDGLFCLDATKKAEAVWNLPSFHIDGQPRVVDGRVYVGCGVGDEFKKTAVFCLDGKTGKPHWRMDTELPVWGRPVVAGGLVYVGSGNGRVNEGAEKPAGEVMCLRDGEGKGDVVWSKKFPDGVLGSLVADRRHLYFGCRDGYLYGLRRCDGEQVWRRNLSAPVVMTPALEGWGESAPGGRLYAGGLDGHFVCVESRTGRLIWERDLRVMTNSPVEVIASPALEVVEVEGAEVYRLYVGVTLVSAGRVGELYCIEDRMQ